MKSDLRELRRRKVLRNAVLIFLCLLSLLPFYLMFVNATRTSNQIKGGISFLFGASLSANLRNFGDAQVGLGISVLGAMEM